MLAAIAYLKIGEINEVNETRLLLNIDRQWNSRMMVEARTIVHRLYIENGGAKIPKKKSLAEVCKKISEKITYMSKSPKKNVQKEFVLLLNYLDFMETIRYLNFKRQGVRTSKLNALCGETLKFNYMIFENYIKHKREKHGKNIYYQYFQKLDAKLKDEKY